MQSETMNRYVIATHSFLVAIDFDSEFRVVRHFVINDSGHHYGIALTGDKDRFIAKHIDEELMMVEARPPFSITSTIPLQPQVGYVHQIAAANGGVYVTNTKYNSLVFVGADGACRHKITFGNKHEDINHINSVYPCGNQIIVLLHNRGRSESEVCILRHDLRRGFQIRHRMRLWHTGCHNVFVDDTNLYYNASKDQAFVVVDLKQQEIVHYLELPGHVKGMSLRGNTFLLGVSEVAERDKRVSTRGRVAVVERESFSVRKMVDVNFNSLPHPIGNINEIRCISGGERAHHHSRISSVDWSGIELNRRTATQVLHQLAQRQFQRVKAGVRNIFQPAV